LHLSAVILDRVYFISNQTEQFDVKIFNEELILDLIKNNLGLNAKQMGYSFLCLLSN
jgi:hypothetical protein